MPSAEGTSPITSFQEWRHVTLGVSDGETSWGQMPGQLDGARYRFFQFNQDASFTFKPALFSD